MDDFQALLEHCRDGHMRELREYFRDPEHAPQIHMTGAYSESLLHVAAHNGYVQIIQLLVDKGANVNSSDDYDRIPLHSAAQMGHVDATSLLLNLGSDIENTTSSLMTPLMYAASTGSLGVTRLLVRRGANLFATNSSGSTALHIAAMNGETEVAVYLISVGADANQQNDDGETPIDMAMEEEIANSMIEAVNASMDALEEEESTHADEITSRLEEARRLWKKYETERSTSIGSLDFAIFNLRYSLEGNPLINVVVCPITEEVMLRPVVAADGITYEKAAIHAWFLKHSTSPVLGIELVDLTLRQSLSVMRVLKSLAQVSVQKTRMRKATQ